MKVNTFSDESLSRKYLVLIRSVEYNNINISITIKTTELFSNSIYQNETFSNV